MRNQFLYSLIFIALFISSCKDDDETTNNPVGSENPVGIVENPYTSGQTVSADLLGRITDRNDNPVAGAAVSFGNSMTLTNSMGFYKIEGATIDDAYALIKVEKDGYFDQYRALTPSDNQMNYADIQIIARVVNGFFNTESGGTIDVPGGGSVSFPAGNLVTSSGTPYSGDVLTSSTYLDPSDPDILSYMPGSLLAVDENDQPSGMVTFGMIGLELRGVNGQSLQLAGGRQATITLPLPSTHSSSAPQSIPLWYFDETAGVWQGEGEATLEGQAYVGKVSHFTFWNFDVPFLQVLVSGSVVYDLEDTSPVGLYMTVTRPNGQYIIVELGPNGEFSGWTPTDEILTLEIFASNCFGNSDPIYSAEIGPFSDDTTLDPIDLVDFVVDDNSLNTSGTVLDCDGNPLEGAIVNVQGSNISAYTVTDENGSFGFLFGCVQSGQLSLDILDPSSLTASDEGDFSFNVATSNELSFGDIVFCDEEAVPDFITYDDGFNQITFEEVNFDPTAPGCTDLEAFNFGNPVVDYLEGIQVDLETVEDTIGFNPCGDQQIEARGYLDSGEYLVYTSIPNVDYFINPLEYIESDDQTLVSGSIFIFEEQSASTISIYEDETMSVLVDEYVSENVTLTYQLIW